MTYAALQADILALGKRSDLSSSVTSFIARAEHFLFRELQLTDLEAEVTGTVTGNAIALPTGFMAVQRLEINDASLAYANGNDVDTNVTAYPVDYTIEDAAIRIVNPVADGTAYTLHYTAKLTPLSVSNTTNWLLTNAYDLYLAASMAELFRHTRNAEQEMKELAKLNPIMDSVRSSSNRKKFPLRSGLQIKPRR